MRKREMESQLADMWSEIVRLRKEVREADERTQSVKKAAASHYSGIAAPMHLPDSRTERRLETLERMFMDHHDIIEVVDLGKANAGAGGKFVVDITVPRLVAYTGRMPQPDGRRITEHRDPSTMHTTYFIDEQLPKVADRG